MSEQFGIVTAEHCYLRKAPGSSGTQNESGIEDEIFSGWAVRLIPAGGAADIQRLCGTNGWVEIETHYGYRGYVRAAELRAADRSELLARQDKSRYFRIGIGEADLLNQPKVQGLPLELLQKNALVELLDSKPEEGWSRIRTAAGREGYIHMEYLCERKDDDGYFLTGRRMLSEDTDEHFSEHAWRRKAACSGAEGGTPESYFRARLRENPQDEAELRDRVVKSAMAYLGTQYRWGGKSAQGIDCSGLVFMSYLENGVIIYRDARIMPEYPVDEIPKEALRAGDLIFFPGHVAMYIGDGRYIHSTAYAKTPYVTINSLDPEAEDYREDLAQKITGCGSIFSERRPEVLPEYQEGKTQTDAASGILEALEKRLAALPGSISMFYKNLDTGEQYAYRADEPHLAASIIKLFLMAAVFECFQEGRLHPRDQVRIMKKDCVPSCGVLTYLPEEHTMSVRDLVELMIIVSDNTAANALFDLVGEDYLNTFIRRYLGMEQTVFHRKMFDSERAARGIENYVTASDAAALLERIWKGQMVSPEASREMYGILTHQRLNGKIPFFLHTLPNAPVIAHKTGEDSGITHDVGIIEGKQPFILCFLGSATDVPEYERLMAKAAADIYQEIMN